MKHLLKVITALTLLGSGLRADSLASLDVSAPVTAVLLELELTPGLPVEHWKRLN